MIYPKEFKRLYTFKVVYESNSFTEAAKILFVTQAGVSVHIQQLENELDVSLFDRNTRHKITPTEEGRILYQQVSKLLDQWNDTVHLLNKVSASKLSCSIGASNSFSISYLPDLMDFLIAKHPNVEFTLKEQNSETIYNAVLQRDLDFGFVERPFALSEKANTQEVLHDQLVLAGNPSSSLWLLREDHSGIQHYNLNYLDQNNLKPANILNANTNDLIIRLLKKGLGQTILSIKNIEDTKIPYTELDASYSRHFYLLSPTPPTAVYQDIYQSIETWLKSL